MQFVKPCKLKVPARHLPEHVDVFIPVSDPYTPAGQLLQEVCATLSEYVPILHGSQVPLLVPIVPAGQAEHASTETKPAVVLNLPAGQTLHNFMLGAPLAAPYRP
jgi:hypothetical protein